MEIADASGRLRQRIKVIVDDLPSLRGQVGPKDSLAPHLIDRLLVATDNASGCAVLAENNLAAPLASAARSVLENLFASHWASQNEKNAAVLLKAMHNEMLRLMKLNLVQGHAEIRHEDTGEVHTADVLSDPMMTEAARPPQFRMMAETAGLKKLYDMIYGFMSMLAHGTATELLAARDQGELISSNLITVTVLLRCIHLVVVNRIQKKRPTEIAEFEAILKVSLA